MVTVELLPYSITIEAGALEQLPEIVHAIARKNRIFVLTDVEVGARYGTRIARLLGQFDAAIISTRMDETRKTRETWGQLTDTLLEHGCGRDTTLVALGGGVVGDVVGFVAATYMRGIPYVQVPTTLLAMVDASVGGKTGVDTPSGKNLVGAFHQPAAVVIDPLVLETLPTQHLRAGFAEIIKHGVVADAEYFARTHDYIERSSGSDAPIWPELTAVIARSVEIKAGIVARDERESGLRKVLNFGHTIGHAIEAATSYQTLHGEAVAIGMIAEARIAEHIGVATQGTASEIVRVCRSAGLPTSIPAISAETLIKFTRSDKKVRAGRVEYALPTRIGEMAGGDHDWAVPVEDLVVREVLSA